MSSPISNSESVRKSLSPPFATRGRLLPENYTGLWNADQEKTPRLLEIREAVARSRAQNAPYILNLENKIESLQAEATNYRLALELWKRDYQKIVNEKKLLEIRLYFQKQNTAMFQTISARWRAAAIAYGVPSMWPQQDLLVNSAQGAPSGSRSDNSGDVSLQEASSSSNRPAKRAKHVPVRSRNNQG
ncbi:hypothetical protein C5167_041036 [Papaver somniferum]|uniref:Uncharacterized protein n=2 Tax=Papaver somniferum TaxID=3469 RepID=A0A4Y7IKW2_PAPSO|nr:hypothetical protein C5167_041036 [Papaver somniferum]